MSVDNMRGTLHSLVDVQGPKVLSRKKNIRMFLFLEAVLEGIEN